MPVQIDEEGAISSSEIKYDRKIGSEKLRSGLFFDENGEVI